MTIEQSIALLGGKLADIPFDFAFLGGALLSLLVTDHTVDAIRVTKDVDVMMDIRTRSDYHKVDTLLEKIGFQHDIRDDAPICRWVFENVTVDVLPIREDVLGWSSKWFEEALKGAVQVECGERLVKIISAPYFVALKIEAFEERGNGDFLTSTDFEDIICLFNGRASIVDEIAACPTLRTELAAKFLQYLKSNEMDDAVEGFVQTEDDPERRKKMILDRFVAVSLLE